MTLCYMYVKKTYFSCRSGVFFISDLEIMHGHSLCVPPFLGVFRSQIQYIVESRNLCL